MASAQYVVATLGSSLAWFWAPNGAVHDVAPAELLGHERPFEVDYVPSRPAIWPDIEQALDTLPVEDPIFLLALHGGAGEDGTLQAMLERRGIPFTGSGSAASAAAFDKARTKDAVRDHVRVADSRVAHDSGELAEIVEAMLAEHEKLVLKPLAGGSSRGLFFVERSAPIKLTIDVPYLVEQFIAGREISAGVIDRGNGPQALPLIEVEMDPGHTFDYDSKYLSKGSLEICPANLPDALAREAQRLAVAAHQALGCDGYSRSDFVAAEDGCWFLELNTLPGLTRASLLPQMLHAGGVDFRTFLEEQLALAVTRAGAAASRR